MTRWIINGQLKLTSALGVRSGAEETNATRPTDADIPKKDGGTAATVMAIELGHGGKPYIPGSTLKGVLRSWLVERAGSDPKLAELIETVFGREPRDIGEGKQQSLGGIAEVLDAPLSSDSFAAPAHGATRIDRKTRAAERTSLRQTRTIAPGACFEVEIVLDKADAKDAALVIKALRAFTGDASLGQLSLGGGKGAGLGLAQWVGEKEKIERLGPAEVKKWLEGASCSWRKAGKSNGKQDVEAALPALAEAPAVVTATITITLASPFLSSVMPEKASGGADRAPRRRGGATGDYVLPGSSIRGAVKSQVQRIAETVLQSSKDAKTHGPRVLALVGELFGATDQAGALSFSDFVVQGAPQARTQEFVAIDRFTGGAAKAKKFSADVLEAPVLTGTVALRLSGRTNHSASGKTAAGADTPDLSAGALGLLVLALRDLIEGDIAFGYGAAKGFGAGIAVVSKVSGEGALAKWAKCAGNLVGDDVGARLAQSPNAWRASGADEQQAAKKLVTAFLKTAGVDVKEETGSA